MESTTLLYLLNSFYVKKHKLPSQVDAVALGETQKAIYLYGFKLHKKKNVCLDQWVPKACIRERYSSNVTISVPIEHAMRTKQIPKPIESAEKSAEIPFNNSANNTMYACKK